MESPDTNGYVPPCRRDLRCRQGACGVRVPRHGCSGSFRNERVRPGCMAANQGGAIREYGASPPAGTGNGYRVMYEVPGARISRGVQ